MASRGKSIAALRRQESDLVDLARESPFPVMREVSAPTPTAYCFVEGPEGTPYENTVFAVRICMSSDYPFTSPSIGFCRGSVPFHSNVESRGSICLNTLNKEWAPATRLTTAIAVHITALLVSPNHSDPFNPEAAALAEENIAMYEEKARLQCKTRCVMHWEKGEPALKLDPDLAMSWLIAHGAGITVDDDPIFVPVHIPEASSSSASKKVRLSEEDTPAAAAATSTDDS